MQIQYACYDYILPEEEIKKNITNALKLGIKNISTYSYSLSSIRSLISNDIDLSVPVDFPYGISDSKIRNFSINQLSKIENVKTIDLAAPAKILVNRKYDKFRDDVKSNLDICNENNIKLRYVLEYRIFSHEILAKVCQILYSLGIKEVFPSTGQMLDDINDNIIATKYLSSKSEIKVISNGNIWNLTQIDNIKNSSIYGIRFHNINSLELFLKNNAVK